jgi:hypothetical protein|tara:strand:+ start:26 stop:538 length:513 start_codon:yes stop_codon:yes gene_type:complete
MNQYKNKIKSFIKNRYSHANYHDSKFFKDFKNFRNDFKKELETKPTKNVHNKKDVTYFELREFFETKKYNQERIEQFYKKFEVNFRLKEKYNKNNKLLSKKETSYQSYIYLGHLILKLKKIDVFQKLNIILKILDKLSVDTKKYIFYDKFLLLKLLEIEEKLIKQIYKNG